MFKIFNPFFWIKAIVIGFIALTGLSYVGIKITSPDSTFSETLIENLDTVIAVADAVEKASGEKLEKELAIMKSMNDTTVVEKLYQQHRINTIEFKGEPKKWK